MDNPFMIGDLVHVPKGVIVYEDSLGIWPLEITKAVYIAIISKNASNVGTYEVLLNGEICHLKKEDMYLLTRKAT
jgi:hypothetical protein